jgi:hypothetical protein
VFTVDRRHLLKNSLAFGGLASLGATMSQTAEAQSARVPLMDRPFNLAPIRAHVDRIYDIKCCIRPFRTKGPRLDVEQIGDAVVIHNYGHSGAGWSLSWGSADMQVQKAMSRSPKKIAVIGCGIMGLTSALMAQRAGAQVTIYTRELLQSTRSVRANGSWTPASHMALAADAPSNLGDVWERMTRISWKNLRQYIGMAGNPLAFADHYYLSDTPFDTPLPPPPPSPIPIPEYYELGDRIGDITPKLQVLTPDIHPFPVKYARRTTRLFFNFSEYGHVLMSDFYAAGGKIVMRNFHSPGELAHLPEKVIINCPGYSAHDWWKDKAMVPHRGQTEWLIPQPEVNYGLTYRNVEALSKSDGIMMIDIGARNGLPKGYGSSNEMPNRAEAEAVVRVMEELYSRFPATPI